MLIKGFDTSIADYPKYIKEIIKDDDNL